MELTESIESINRQLIDLFGIDTITSQAMWRVVWAEDQYEKQLTEYSDKGVLLLRPEVRELPKYSWIKGKYILEHLGLVPEVNLIDLPTQKITYSNIWTFEDKNDNPLPPRIGECQFLANLVTSAMQRKRDGLSPIKKFIDKEWSQEASLEDKANRINEMCEALYGEDAEFHDSKLKGSTVVLSDKGVR